MHRSHETSSKWAQRRTADQCSTAREAAKRQRSIALSVSNWSNITHLVCIVREHLQYILGSEHFFSFPWFEGDDRIVNLLFRQDSIVQSGVRVDGVLPSVSRRPTDIGSEAYPIRRERSLLDDYFPPLRGWLIKAGKKYVDVTGESACVGHFVLRGSY